jgi:hypothetical protein
VGAAASARGRVRPLDASDLPRSGSLGTVPYWYAALGGAVGMFGFPISTPDDLVPR